MDNRRMARTPEEQRANARKYGRRRALLEAAGNAEQQTALAHRLLKELKAAGAADATLRGLVWVHRPTPWEAYSTNELAWVARWLPAGQGTSRCAHCSADAARPWIALRRHAAWPLGLPTAQSVIVRTVVAT